MLTPIDSVPTQLELDTAFFKAKARAHLGKAVLEKALRPLRTPPFYAVEVRPAIICWTGCGLRVDADLRVVNQQEQAIPGLYAAGETVGSLHGDRYIGGGGSFGPCITFGRLAGANAAGFAHARGQ